MTYHPIDLPTPQEWDLFRALIDDDTTVESKSVASGPSWWHDYLERRAIRDRQRGFE